MENREFNLNPTFAILNLGSLSCLDDCFGVDHPNEGLLVSKFGDSIKVYTVRGVEVDGRAVQFYVNTADRRDLINKGVLISIGISFLVTALIMSLEFYIIKRK